MKKKLLLISAALISGVCGWAQTDVTSQYIQNPSFELASEGTALSGVQKAKNAALSMYGWKESGQGSEFNNSEILNATTESSSQFGKKVTPSDGSYYFFVRQGWTNSTSIKLISNEMSLPAGYYTLSVDYKQAYSYDNTTNSNTKTSLAFAAGGADVSTVTSGAAVAFKGGDNTTYFQTEAWSTLTTSFHLEESTTGNVEIRFAIAGQRRSDFLVDNIRLLYSKADVSVLKSIIAKAEKYNETLKNDELTAAISTAKNSLTDGYAEQESVDTQVATLKTAIDNAFKSGSAPKLDVTELMIENPSFETGSLSPWTANNASDTGVKQNSNETYKISNAHGSYLFNTWGGSDEKYVKQTLTMLPDGYYKMSALVASDAGNVVKLFAGDKFVEAASSPEGKGIGVYYTTPKVYVSNGTLEIGAKSTSWYKADNFTLTYYTELGAAQDDLVEKIAEAKALIESGIYKGTDYLQSVITDSEDMTTSTDKSVIDNAISNINTAIVNLKISNASMKVPYEMAVKNADMETTSDWIGAELFKHPTDNENPGSNVKRPYFETWVAAPNTQQNDRKFYQVIADCPQGTYELQAAVTATYQVANTNVNENTGVYLYVKDGETITRTACKSGNAAQYFSVIINHEAQGDLEIGIEMEAETRVNWVAFDNFSLKCYGIGNYDALAQRNYATAKALAQEKSNVNVTGYETKDLVDAINNTPSTTEDYIAGANELLVKTVNFTEAEATYNRFAEVKAEYAGYLGTLKYASKAIEESFELTLHQNNASAQEAANAIENIYKKCRAYYESNAKAEGVTGATDCTSLVVNANFSDGLNGWSSTQSGGNLGTLNNQTWTNSDGSAGGYYYDYYNGSANNQHGYQVVNNLTPGKYIVTLKARAQSGFYLNLLINDKKQVDINEIGNTGGIFNNGWNDYTTEFVVDKAGTVKIEVANQPSSNQSGWFGFGDVRLYRLGDLDEVALDEDVNNTITAGLAKVTLKRTIVKDVWNTLVLPFEMSNEEVLSVFGEGAKVAAFSNAAANDVYFNTTEEGIKANTPVLIKAAAGTEFTFDGYTLVDGTAKAEGAMFDFVGSYAPTDLANGDYMLSGNKFWKNEDKRYNVKGFRAYLSPKTSTEVKSLNLIMDDVATGITITDLDVDAEGKTYNMAGQRVSSNYKGLVIKNGKKTINK